MNYEPMTVWELIKNLDTVGSGDEVEIKIDGKPVDEAWFDPSSNTFQITSRDED